MVSLPRRRSRDSRSEFRFDISQVWVNEKECVGIRVTDLFPESQCAAIKSLGDCSPVLSLPANHDERESDKDCHDCGTDPDVHDGVGTIIVTIIIG